MTQKVDYTDDAADGQGDSGKSNPLYEFMQPDDAL